MPKPLGLFIAPPYANWKLLHGYGFKQQPPQTGEYMHLHAALTTTANEDILAAASGQLSAKPPLSWMGDPLVPVELPSSSNPLPDTTKLFLHLPPGVMIDPLFAAQARQLASPSFNTRLIGFMYEDLETASLEAALGDLLDGIALPRGIVTRAQAVELILRGEASVRVPVGHAIAKAAPFAGGTRRVAFSALTQVGVFDPAYVYDSMRNFVEDGQQTVDDFLGLVPKQWPVLNVVGSAGVLSSTAKFLYSMPVLREAKEKHKLLPAEWRKVGDNQKALWRKRLLSRVGHAPAGSTAPPFEFDDSDWQNTFQLEAVTEFYLNFNDPWRSPPPELGENRPRPPLLATGQPDIHYQIVDLLNPAGVKATVQPDPFESIVTLDNPSLLERVRANVDTIYLEADTARESGRYRITKVDKTTNTVKVLGTPAVPSAGSRWEIALRPVIIVIDPFGARDGLRGQVATRPAGAAANVLQLDGAPALARINPNFDTIYLPADTARASRAYRITAVDDATNRVTLDGSPNLPANSSTWHIQSGLSGEVPPLGRINLVGDANGFDHYDGVAFVVTDGLITFKGGWSSYSSRALTDSRNNPRPHGYFSSIRGNKIYDYASYRSGNRFINYCFKVTDPRAAYDGVREARFYFDTPVGDDSTAGNPADPGAGKTWVRLHHGNERSVGTGSDGCSVSPGFNQLRSAIIRPYLAEHRELHGTPDNEVAKVLGRDQAASQALYDLAPNRGGLTNANWDDKLVGSHYLIRPDERPEG